MTDIPKKLFNMDIIIGEKTDLSAYPAIYGHAFDIHSGSIGNLPCTFALSNDEVRLPFLIKMVRRLQDDLKMPLVVVCPKLSIYQMERLSEENIAWIASPGNALIPFLGLAVRKSELMRPKAAPLSPQAQRLATHIIDGSWTENSTTEVAALMSKSLSSTSNYFKEIAAIAPAAFTSNGRQRNIRRLDFNERAGLLDAIEPFATNPVAKRTYYTFEGDASELADLVYPYAGITALSQKTMLADDPWVTFASTSEYLPSKLATRLREVSRNDAPDILLETWRYNPDALHGCVNSVSLYLSLKDDANDDPRLEEALDQLKEKMLS